MRTVKTNLSKHTKAVYILSRDEGEYTITIIEESKLDNKTSIFSAPHITPSYRVAKQIFKKICQERVFGATLLDVVYNLLS